MSSNNQAPMNDHFLKEMMTLKKSRSKRASSWDRTGANYDAITFGAGETAVLADIKGPGCIRHIYFTTNHGDRFYMRKAILRMYWDGEETPSVEVPLGDFFGLGFCETRFFHNMLVTTAPGNREENEAPYCRLIGLNSYFPMPFKKSARITLENDSPAAFSACWYHIDYEEHDQADDEVAYFHAQWRRENPTVPIDPPNEHNLDGKENYVILDAEGWGNYVGMFLNVDNITGGWYGEGDDMIFIDDDEWPPSMHGTGSEEIFGGGACPSVQYTTPYTGYHLISNKDFSGKQSMYRFHVNDPVRFQKRIKVTIEHGTGNDLGNDYSSTAFWYQQEPHAPFPALMDADARLPRMDDKVLEIYKVELQTQGISASLLKSVNHDVKVFMEKYGEQYKPVGELLEEIQKLSNEEKYEDALAKANEMLNLVKKMAQS